MKEKRSKPPAFQLYAADFLTDTQSMTAQELGVYFRLMCSQWINKGVPMDTQKLSRLAGVSVKVFKRIWPEIQHKFVEKEVNKITVLVNERLEESRADKEKYIESQSLKGKLSAEKKKAEKEKLNSTGVENRLEPKFNSSSSSSSSSSSLKEKTNKKEFPENNTFKTNGMVSTVSSKPVADESEILPLTNPNFTYVWKEYSGQCKKQNRRPGNKNKSSKLFDYAIKNKIASEVVQSIMFYAEDCILRDRYLKNLESFLSKSENYVAEWENGSENHQALLDLKSNGNKNTKNNDIFESKAGRMQRGVEEYRESITSVLCSLPDDLFAPEEDQKLIN